MYIINFSFFKVFQLTKKVTTFVYFGVLRSLQECDAVSCGFQAYRCSFAILCVYSMWELWLGRVNLVIK